MRIALGTLSIKLLLSQGHSKVYFKGEEDDITNDGFNDSKIHNLLLETKKTNSW